MSTPVLPRASGVSRGRSSGLASPALSSPSSLRRSTTTTTTMPSTSKTTSTVTKLAPVNPPRRSSDRLRGPAFRTGRPFTPETLKSTRSVSMASVASAASRDSIDRQTQRSTTSARRRADSKQGRLTAQSLKARTSRQSLADSRMSRISLEERSSTSMPRWSAQLRASVQSSGYGYGAIRKFTVVPPEPVVDEEALEQERLEAEQLQLAIEAEVERVRQAKLKWRRELLADVKRINTEIVVRHCAEHWKMVTAMSRDAGPHGLPESERAFVKLDCTDLSTPKNAVVAFLLATFKYKKDRGTGERMMARTLHPDLLAGNYAEDLENLDVDEAAEPSPEARESRSSLPSTPSKRKLRKSTRLRLQTLRSNTLASYVVGTSPENGYALNPEAVGFKFNMLLSSTGFGKPDHPIPDTATATVHVITSGALPPTRAVQLTYHNGKWKVRDFSNLCTNVLPPLELDEEEEKAALEAKNFGAKLVRVRRVSLDKPKSFNALDRGFVEGHMRIFDNGGKVIGYEQTRASLLGKSARGSRSSIRSARLSRESFPTGFTRAPQLHRSKHFNMEIDETEPSNERHERARLSTQSQAEDLAAKDFIRDWQENPSMARRVVTQGMEPTGKMAAMLKSMESKGVVVQQASDTQCRAAAVLASKTYKIKQENEAAARLQLQRHQMASREMASPLVMTTS